MNYETLMETLLLEDDLKCCTYYWKPWSEAILGAIYLRISSNRMRALYLFQCFDIACTIQGRFVFEGALYFLPMKSYRNFT